MRWDYRAPVRVGDEITARRRVADVTQREGKRGGTMTFVSVEIELTNQDDELVAVQTDTIIETAADERACPAPARAGRGAHRRKPHAGARDQNA